MTWLALGCAVFVVAIATTAIRAARQSGEQQPDEHAEFLGADAGGAGAFTHVEGN